jgi:unsaturated rhamnogalacturonyl hydrolase
MKLVLILLVSLFSNSTIDAQVKAPEMPAKKIAGNILTRNNYFLYEGGKGLHYAEVFAAVASLKTAEILNDKGLQDSIINRYKELLDVNSRLISERSHVDHNVQAVLPFAIFKLTGKEEFKELGLKYANSQWDETDADGLTTQARWWIDDMYMIGMLQLSAFRATGNKIYLQRTSKILATYLTKLQQPNGLFLHGPGAPFYWCRGNGWVASILGEALTDIPSTDSNYKLILNAYKKMMNTLVKYQSTNGMWRQLIDYKYSWAESSGTAMFAFSMTRGVDLGLLKKRKYKVSANKAFDAVMAQVNRAGEIREVCVGTNKMPDRDFYLERPRVVGDFHGQAPLLWLINERLTHPEF